MSEHWVQTQVYCPSCGEGTIQRYENNRPVADFYCSRCGEDFELKSQRGTIGTRIVDGAYDSMVARITGNQNPNFFLLSYNGAQLAVTDLVIVPKQFFTPMIIERRHPLATTARRAGWVGCNIKLGGIPTSGRIALVSNGIVVPKNNVIEAWQQMLFLREQTRPETRGWLLAVMSLIDRVGRSTFSLSDLYSFESDVQLLYPENRHIKAKIRQQLQVLRHKGYIKFSGRGNYVLVKPKN